MKKIIFLIVIVNLSWLTAQKSPQFDAVRAFGYLEEQCSFGPRNPGSEGHSKGLKHIMSIVSKLADNVIVQFFPYSDPYTGAMWEMTNVIAQFNPDKKERIWIAAHWDTRPWADKDPDPNLRSQPILGANDGASGVAVLLELAHSFAEISPKVGVDLIFFDGEDSGKSGELENFFIGSRYLTQNIPTALPRYCILIDMVGDRDLKIPQEMNSMVQAPELMKELWMLAESLGLLSFKNKVSQPVEDDHVILFREGGIPSVDIIDFDYRGGRENYWHTHKDTPDKCSPESLEEVGTLLLNHIYNAEN